MTLIHSKTSVKMLELASWYGCERRSSHQWGLRIWSRNQRNQLKRARVNPAMIIGGFCDSPFCVAREREPAHECGLLHSYHVTTKSTGILSRSVHFWVCCVALWVHALAFWRAKSKCFCSTSLRHSSAPLWSDESGSRECMCGSNLIEERAYAFVSAKQ